MDGQSFIIRLNQWICEGLLPQEGRPTTNNQDGWTRRLISLAVLSS